MSPNFKCFISFTVIIFFLACVLALPSCTTVSVQHPNGLLIKVNKFHPMGEELEIDGVLDNVGTLKINKSTTDSKETVDAIVNGLLSAGR